MKLFSTDHSSTSQEVYSKGARFPEQHGGIAYTGARCTKNSLSRRGKLEPRSMTEPHGSDFLPFMPRTSTRIRAGPFSCAAVQRWGTSAETLYARRLKKRRSFGHIRTPFSSCSVCVLTVNGAMSPWPRYAAIARFRARCMDADRRVTHSRRCGTQSGSRPARARVAVRAPFFSRHTRASLECDARARSWLDSRDRPKSRTKPAACRLPSCTTNGSPLRRLGRRGPRVSLHVKTGGRGGHPFYFTFVVALRFVSVRASTTAVY